MASSSQSPGPAERSSAAPGTVYGITLLVEPSRIHEKGLVTPVAIKAGSLFYRETYGLSVRAPYALMTPQPSEPQQQFLLALAAPESVLATFATFDRNPDVWRSVSSEAATAARRAKTQVAIDGGRKVRLNPKLHSYFALDAPHPAAAELTNPVWMLVARVLAEGRPFPPEYAGSAAFQEAVVSAELKTARTVVNAFHAARQESADPSVGETVDETDALRWFALFAGHGWPVATPMTSMTYGYAFCPHAAFLNHSCYPNAVMVPAEGLGLMALRDIAEGEEITVSYAHDLKMSAEARAEYIKSVFHFTCVCPACVAKFMDFDCLNVARSINYRSADGRQAYLNALLGRQVELGSLSSDTFRLFQTATQTLIELVDAYIASDDGNPTLAMAAEIVARETPAFDAARASTALAEILGVFIMHAVVSPDVFLRGLDVARGADALATAYIGCFSGPSDVRLRSRALRTGYIAAVVLQTYAADILQDERVDRALDRKKKIVALLGGGSMLNPEEMFMTLDMFESLRW